MTQTRRFVSRMRPDGTNWGAWDRKQNTWWGPTCTEPPVELADYLNSGERAQRRLQVLVRRYAVRK